MKKIAKRILSLILAGVIGATFTALPQSPESVQAASTKAWKKINGKCYNGKGTVISGAVTRGIDVSEWQGNINWNKVADSDVDYAFIRVGGYGNGSYQRLDKTYEANIKGANAAGVPVGVYYYSTAKTTTQAKKDAQYVIKQITGHKISYPVVMDMEDATLTYLSPTTKSKIVDAFLSEIKRAGYYPMVYTNVNWYNNEYNMSMLAGYDVWIAQYNSSSTPPSKSNYRYSIWQATDGTSVVGLPTTKGLISGIPSENVVDLNFGYVDYTKKITPRTKPLSSYSPDGTVKNGWVKENGKYYYYNKGTLYKNKLFKVNGHIYYVDSSGVRQSGWKTINGKKYEFDENGAMTAEWSLDVESASKAGARASYSTVTTNSVPAKYAQQWRYFQDVENGARVSKGWFKVVAAEYLNYEKNNDGEDAWYYADGSGNLYAGEFKTIKGKKYAFRTDGRMIDGLKFIYTDSKGNIPEDGVKADDDDYHPFDTEDDFINSANWYEQKGYKCYYFGDGDDGAMRTNKNTIEIDGDKFNFFFEKSGSKKGSGKTGEEDDKFYQSGMLLKAGKDEKYQVIKTLDANKDKNDDGDALKGYKKLDDVQAFREEVAQAGETILPATTPTDALLSSLGINKKADDVDELYVVPTKDKDGLDVKGKYFLVNTSGKVINSKSKNKDGNDYYYVVEKAGKVGNIVAIYTEK